MQDMLVRLLDLPDIVEDEKRLLEEHKIVFRRPIAPEKNIVSDWVGTHFSAYWQAEVEVAFAFHPVHCFLAQKGDEIIGFSCYECTAKNFFGPTGVLDDQRGLGIGKVLLIKSLLGLHDMGYAYAIIGGVGPASYYEKVVGAKVISGSEKSVYEHLIRRKR